MSWLGTRPLWPSIWAAVVIWVLASPGPMAGEARDVLFLHSFGPHSAPFNSFAGHFRAELVRKGIVGGPLLPVDAPAAEAADMTAQLPDGAAPSALRPPLSAASFRFDARRLARWGISRWGISETRLPPGSRVRFREPTAWELYRRQILMIAAALAIEGGFIVTLLVNRGRLRWSRAALRTSEAEARELSGRLIHAQEEERAWLARELHDDTTQRLALLAIRAGQGERAAGNDAERAPWTEMREELARLGDDVHALSYRLHPSILADLGLAEALRSECRRFARVEEIAVSKDICEVPEWLPDGTALGLFRIAQEALRNVARHAGASRVEVALRRERHRLSLRVADDGCGFDARPGLTRGLGLASMRQRAALIGGEIDVRSGTAGTEVRISAPIGGEKS